MKSRRRSGSSRLRSVERLESRAMMSADGLGVTPADDGAVQTPTTAAATFASLEDLRQWVTQQATARYGELFGTTVGQSPLICWGCDSFGVVRAIPFGMQLFNDAATTSTVADQTNVQVEGVDEADLVETDGEFLYLIAGSELVIVDIRDPENLSVASRVQLGETPTGVYLTGDRLTLVSTSTTGSSGLTPILWAGYGYWPNTATPTVTVTVLDVSDREAPTQAEKTEVDGSLVSSRMVDGELRLVTQQVNSGYLPAPRYNLLPVAGEAAAVQPAAAAGLVSIGAIDSLNLWSFQPATYQYESLEEYVDRVVAEWAPSYRTLSVEGEVVSEKLLVDPTQIERPTDPFDYYVSSWRQNIRTTIATFNVLDNAAGPSDTQTLRTHGASTVYADGDNLYVFENLPTVNSNGIWVTGAYFPPTTRVTKFAFGDGGAIHKEAQGTFSGTLLNQFAVDEHDGYLRVVTMNNFSQAGQAISVLQQQGDGLVVVGSVTGLAPNETLHSVRFDGDTAYLVTFRNIDPLFVVDLSDPAAPVVTGELKIPGYSEYLQPIGPNHLLGIGRGADEQTGFFEELQISIFDVTDGSDPRLAHRYSVEGGRATATVATGNRWVAGDGDHHAVAFYEDAGILTLPIRSEGDWGLVLRVWPGESILRADVGGLLVLSVDVTTGIEKLALIEHDSPILRSVRVGDTLIAISATQVSLHRLTSPAEAVDTLDLPTGAEGVTALTAFVADQTSADPGLPTQTTPQRSVRAPYVPAMRSQEVLSHSVAETPQPSAHQPYFVGVPVPEQRGRFTAPARATAASAAASDEALLLLTAAAVTEADESPQDPAVCFETHEDATPEPTERGVRQSWRPTVKA